MKWLFHEIIGMHSNAFKRWQQQYGMVFSNDCVYLNGVFCSLILRIFASTLLVCDIVYNTINSLFVG